MIISKGPLEDFEFDKEGISLGLFVLNLIFYKSLVKIESSIWKALAKWSKIIKHSKFIK